MARIYVPGIAFGRLKDSSVAMWTVVMYEEMDGVFRERAFRRCEPEPGDRDPYIAMERILRSITLGDDAKYVLLFECPACDVVSEMGIDDVYCVCPDCGAHWLLEHAVAEMCIENIPLLKTGMALRERMYRLAWKIGKSVGKPLF